MPKGVSLSSLVDVLSAHDVIMHFPLSPEDRTLNMTPWFHRGGLYSGGPNPVLYCGAEAVALRQFDPGHGARLGPGARAHLPHRRAHQPGHARRRAEARPRDLSTLNGIVTMGAPLDREACLRYQQTLTPRIFNGYGTTEAFWNTFLRPIGPARPRRLGRPGVHRRRRRGGEDLRGPARRPLRSRRQGRERGRRGHVRSVKSGYAYVNQPERAGRALPRRLALHRRPRHLGRGRVRDDRRP